MFFKSGYGHIPIALDLGNRFSGWRHPSPELRSIRSRTFVLFNRFANDR
jgi:hypothetical protein